MFHTIKKITPIRARARPPLPRELNLPGQPALSRPGLKICSSLYFLTGADPDEPREVRPIRQWGPVSMGSLVCPAPRTLTPQGEVNPDSPRWPGDLGGWLRDGFFNRGFFSD